MTTTGNVISCESLGDIALPGIDRPDQRNPMNECGHHSIALWKPHE